MRTGRPRIRVFDEAAALQRFKELKNAQMVAKEFNTGCDVILRLVKRNGLGVNRPGVSAKLSDEQVASCVGLYNAGMSQLEIGKKFSMTQWGIGKILKATGVSARKTKAVLEEHYFDVIDTEEKAYWLGFLTADGNIGLDNAIRLELKSGDAVHVVRFARAIGYSGLLQKRKDESAVLLQPKSVILANALRSLGLMSSTKSVDVVPANVVGKLERHYWRGLIDGDGWIGKDLKSVGLCGTRKMCVGMRDFFLKNGIVTDAQVHRSEERLWRFGIESKEVKKCVVLLYKDAIVALPRKLALAKKIMGEEMFTGVQQARRYQVEIFLEALHYLKDVPFGVVSYGLFEDDVLRGVACFGSPSSPAIASSIFENEVDQKGVRELRRFAMQDAAPNEASQFLAKALRMFYAEHREVSAVVSYADSAQGHIGTIYKACNARYVGCSGEELVFVLSTGERVTGRGMLKRVGSTDGVSVEKSEGKHKYIFFFNGTDKRCLLSAKQYV